MKVIGIDLAGKDTNPSGICLLENRKVKVKTLYADGEMLRFVKDAKPRLVAIDAPLTLSKDNRACDRALKKYGAMPLSLKSIQLLARRGYFLSEKFKMLEFEVIEVFPTATAKILCIYSKDMDELKEGLISLGLGGVERVKTKDEIDSILAAYTGLLYLNDLADAIGDEDGTIVVPRAGISRTILK